MSQVNNHAKVEQLRLAPSVDQSVLLHFGALTALRTSQVLGGERAMAADISEQISRNPILRARHEGIKANWVARNVPAIEKRRLELVTLR
jgi:hypothetical protein